MTLPTEQCIFQAQKMAPTCLTGVATFTRAPFATDFFRHRFFLSETHSPPTFLPPFPFIRGPIRHRFFSSEVHFRHRIFSSEVCFATVTYSSENLLGGKIHQYHLGIFQCIKSFKIYKSVNENNEILCPQAVFGERRHIFTSLWNCCTIAK